MDIANPPSYSSIENDPPIYSRNDIIFMDNDNDNDNYLPEYKTLGYDSKIIYINNISYEIIYNVLISKALNYITFISIFTVISFSCIFAINNWIICDKFYSRLLLLSLVFQIITIICNIKIHYYVVNKKKEIYPALNTLLILFDFCTLIIFIILTNGNVKDQIKYCGDYKYVFNVYNICYLLYFGNNIIYTLFYYYSHIMSVVNVNQNQNQNNLISLEI